MDKEYEALSNNKFASVRGETEPNKIPSLLIEILEKKGFILTDLS